LVDLARGNAGVTPFIAADGVEEKKKKAKSRSAAKETPSASTDKKI